MFRYSGHALLLVLGAIFIFHSPFTDWWAARSLPWYSVFLFWLVLIVLVALDNFKGAEDRRVKDQDESHGD